MTQEDKERIQQLQHARPYSKETAEEIIMLYKKYINPGLTNGCSKCGGSLHSYLKRLNMLMPPNNKSK